MKTPPTLALLAGALVLSGCASLPSYLAWLRPKAPELEIRPMETPAPAATASATDRLYKAAVEAIDRRDYGLALEHLQVALQRSPGDPRVLNALAVTYDKLGRFDLSARFYAEAEAAAPGSPIVTANLAYSHLMQRQYQGLRAPAAVQAAVTPGRQFAALETAPKLAQPKPMLTRATPVLVGRPLLVVDAGGRGLTAASVRTRLASLGWSVTPTIQRAAASKESRILYPAEHRTVALALANTLPFRAALSICQDNCRGLVLVLGENAKWTG